MILTLYINGHGNEKGVQFACGKMMNWYLLLEILNHELRDLVVKKNVKEKAPESQLKSIYL